MRNFSFLGDRGFFYRNAKEDLVCHKECPSQKPVQSASKSVKLVCHHRTRLWPKVRSMNSYVSPKKSASNQYFLRNGHCKTNRILALGPKLKGVETNNKIVLIKEC